MNMIGSADVLEAEGNKDHWKQPQEFFFNPNGLFVKAG